MISHHETVETGPANGRCQVVRWVRSFPFSFIKEREYIIARRAWQQQVQLCCVCSCVGHWQQLSDALQRRVSWLFPSKQEQSRPACKPAALRAACLQGCLYGITKCIPHPRAAYNHSIVRMDTFYSMWRRCSPACCRLRLCELPSAGASLQASCGTLTCVADVVQPDFCPSPTCRLAFCAAWDLLGHAGQHVFAPELTRPTAVAPSPAPRAQSDPHARRCCSTGRTSRSRRRWHALPCAMAWPASSRRCPRACTPLWRRAGRVWTGCAASLASRSCRHLASRSCGIVRCFSQHAQPRLDSLSLLPLHCLCKTCWQADLACRLPHSCSSCSC